MNSPLDIAANRAARKYSPPELLARIAWSAGALVFRLTPRPCFALRRLILRCFGARIGRHVHVYPSTRICMPWNLEIGDWSAVGDDVRLYNLGRITLGQRVTVSHGAHLCAGTHLHERPDFPLVKAPIRVGSDAWICADAYIGPGVEVGAGAVVAARAVAVRDVPEWCVVAGNPARVRGHRRLDGPNGFGQMTLDV